MGLLPGITQARDLPSPLDIPTSPHTYQRLGNSNIYNISDKSLCVHLLVRVSVCPSLHQYITPSLNLSICLSVCLSILLSVCLPVCPSVCLSAHLFARVSVYLYIFLFVSQQVRLSICSFICPSTCLLACLSVCPYVCSFLFGLYVQLSFLLLFLHCDIFTFVILYCNSQETGVLQMNIFQKI